VKDCPNGKKKVGREPRIAEGTGSRKGRSASSVPAWRKRKKVKVSPSLGCGKVLYFSLRWKKKRDLSRIKEKFRGPVSLQLEKGSVEHSAFGGGGKASKRGRRNLLPWGGVVCARS